jgi:NhaP-type Na+/H+ or K+/H+ antiporter
MNWDGELHDDDLHSHFSEGIDSILDVSVFTTLGTVLPWSIWLDKDSPIAIGRLIGFGALVVFFRRLPMVFLLKRWMPAVQTNKEAVFVGWFGPMGIGALYYALKGGESLQSGAKM